MPDQAPAPRFGRSVAVQLAVPRATAAARPNTELMPLYAIVQARASGTSWSEIGRVLGASDQASSKHAIVDAIADNRRAALEHLLRVTT